MNEYCWVQTDLFGGLLVLAALRLHVMMEKPLSGDRMSLATLLSCDWPGGSS
jgi:hypothetical protein